MKKEKKQSWEKEFDKLPQTGITTKDFIRQLLKKPHPTKDGWCCACEYDIACLNDKLRERRKELIRNFYEILRIFGIC